MRSSDSSRPFVISPFVLSDYRSSLRRSAEAERSPRVRTWNFPLHRRPYALPPADIGLRVLNASSPKGRTLHDASLPFGAWCHLRACEEIASDVVRTFRSARHGRPEGLHYSDVKIDLAGEGWRKRLGVEPSPPVLTGSDRF